VRGVPAGTVWAVHHAGGVPPRGSTLLRKTWPVYVRVIEERFVAAFDGDDARQRNDLLALIAGPSSFIGPELAASSWRR
jgi:hypothetical protein